MASTMSARGSVIGALDSLFFTSPVGSLTALVASAPATLTGPTPARVPRTRGRTDAAIRNRCGILTVEPPKGSKRRILPGWFDIAQYVLLPPRRNLSWPKCTNAAQPSYFGQPQPRNSG